MFYPTLRFSDGKIPELREDNYNPQKPQPLCLRFPQCLKILPVNMAVPTAGGLTVPRDYFREIDCFPPVECWQEVSWREVHVGRVLQDE